MTQYISIRKKADKSMEMSATVVEATTQKELDKLLVNSDFLLNRWECKQLKETIDNFLKGDK